MYIKQFSVNERNDWDNFLAEEPFFAFLQSWNWGAFKEQLGWKVYRLAVMSNGRMIAGAQLLIKLLPLGLSIAYVPRGPIGSWTEDKIASLLFSELHTIARQHGAIFLKLEPAVENDPRLLALLERNQFHFSHIRNQPQATILLNLDRDDDEILRQMRKKTRQYIRRAEREGITVRVGKADDIPAFIRLMHLTGKREHFAARTEEYYRKEWEIFTTSNRGVLLLAYLENQLLAARAIYSFGQHAAEFHAGSVDVPGLHPNYLLVWEAIRWAKAQGCKAYDLWGIPDEITKETQKEGNESQSPITNLENGLWGVYQFKRGFSKEVVTYIGAYDYVYRPSYHAILSSKFLNGEIREKITARLDSLKFKASQQSTQE